MSLLYRALVPRGASKMLNPVNLPSARGVLTRTPRRRKSTRKHSTSRKSTR